VQALPLTAERRALLTLVIPDNAQPETNWCDFVGALKDPPCFNEDPVAIQRKMRDEWRLNSKVA